MAGVQVRTAALAAALALAVAACAVRHSIDVGRKAPDCNCAPGAEKKDEVKK